MQNRGGGGGKNRSLGQTQMFRVVEFIVTYKLF